MYEENIKIVESYLSALKTKDLSLVPLDDEMIFADPVSGKGAGAENFRSFLSGFLPAIKDVKVIRHVCQNDFVATSFEADTVFGIIEIGEFFRIENGKITEAIGYFDPRLILS